ncbi:ROK family protein [Rhizobium sp. Leaf341]|uniref:ROK family protein n=1 Tax=Rhizobium sp. Leaf341 TaxID=1736344 RepID=UPI000715B501|nr:ROK family protein [Rhizobium sp. Leaf341]KQR72866.1 glucokinase [Rhizobium sp. Leaf341]
MVTSEIATQDQAAGPLTNGALDLPALTIDDYNIEIRDKDGFIGDKATKAEFRAKLDAWRKVMRAVDIDPIGKVPTADLPKREIDGFLKGKNAQASALVWSAVEDFAQEFADVVTRFLKQKHWSGTERIAVGGGFRQSRSGELAIARTEMLLAERGVHVHLVPIVHHSDDAGLIGAVHLMPAWMLKGHKAIFAVDIGGTNMRAGVVDLGKAKSDNRHYLEEAAVWQSEIWRHADDRPSRSAAVERLIGMLKDLIARAKAENLAPAPLIGIGCPGIIQADGSIERGGQNLPGGNWESDSFNLPAAIKKAIPEIDGHQTVVMMHNDAVVQGLSQIPFMTDISKWAVLTIGTGLGNAHFVNKAKAKA